MTKGRPSLALAVIALLSAAQMSTSVPSTRADQCPPVATTPVVMRVNGYVTVGNSGAPAGTALLAIGPGVGALPSGCSVLAQQGAFSLTVYGYDSSSSTSQTYPREGDTLTTYASDSGGNLTYLRPSQSIIFRSGATVTVDLCSSCNQNSSGVTAAPSTTTPTPSPTPMASPTATPIGAGTATPTPSASITPAPTAAPVAAVSAAGLPPQFAGTPSASLPSNFASGGLDASVQAPPPSVGVFAAPPQVLVVPGPVQLPPDGSIPEAVVLRGSASAPGTVGPAIKFSSGTLVSDASGGVFAGTLSPPELAPPSIAAPTAGQSLQDAYVPALASGGPATYAVQAGGTQIARFSQPAILSLPAHPPTGYEPSDLHVAWFDPALAAWRDISGASTDGSVEVASVDRTGLYAVVAGDAGGFRRFWVQAFRPTTLWSGSDSRAVALGVADQWLHLVVLAPQEGVRLFVRNPSTGGVAFVDAADVGPSGPP